jgi:prevent-host-death family protein
MTRQFTAREFNHDIAAAKRATREGPVIVTDRGVPAHVLLSYDEYRRLVLPQPSRTLADLLAAPGTEDIEFELPPRLVEPLFEFDDE